MTVPLRLGLFVVGLAVVFALGLGLGRLLPGTALPAPEQPHSSMTSHDSSEPMGTHR